MKIVVTGALGHISKPLTETLVQQGHAVTVISSSPERQPEIEALGATAAIGGLEDVDFLTAAFTGADASTTALSVSEIAYALGFEHSQSFSKLFKSKAGMSPVAFRQSFN